MIEQAPRVSVIVPCYKQAHYLPISVGSALAQTYPNIEVIVIDDGSPDDTPAAAAAFGDRIIYHRQPNAGLAAARNKGLSLATGQFIAFLDSDDAFDPDALAVRLQAIDRDPAIVAACCGWREIDGEGRETSNHSVPPQADYLTLLRENFAPPVCWMVRKSVFECTGPFDAQFYGHEDWDLWLRIASLPGAKIATVPTTHVRYRVHAQSMTSSRIRSMFRGGRDVLLAQRRRGDLPDEARRLIAQGLRNFRQQYIGKSIARAMKGPGRVGATAKVGFEISAETIRDPMIAFEGLRGLAKFVGNGFRWPFQSRT